MADETHPEKTPGILPWLFPLTLLLHLAEEYWGGGGFSAYIERTRGINLPPSRFLLMNSIGLGLMVLGVVLARRFAFTHWLLACYGAIVFGNGLSHTLNGIVTREYNPGLITGLLIWIPLGLWTLLYLKKKMPRRRFWTAFAIGFAILIVVVLLTLSGGNPLSLLSR